MIIYALLLSPLPCVLQGDQVYLSTSKRMHFVWCGFARAYDGPDKVWVLGDALGKGRNWANCCEV